MDRAAVFVDAGYLFASGSILTAGMKLPRSELELNYTGVVGALQQHVATVSGLPLLRIYWYDGTATGPTPQHLALAYLPSVKLRLGFVNRQGEQKGVDSLIVTDMIELARNRAMADAILMSGDEDIRVGVQQAQEFGIRVHLLGIEPARRNQSGFLVQEADSVHEWGRADVQRILSRVQRPAPPVPTAPQDAQQPVPPAAAPPAPAAALVNPDIDQVLRRVAAEIAAGLAPQELEALLLTATPSQVPQDIDRRLLLGGSQALRTRLDSSLKKAVRVYFFEASRLRKDQLDAGRR